MGWRRREWRWGLKWRLFVEAIYDVADDEEDEEEEQRKQQRKQEKRTGVLTPHSIPDQLTTSSLPRDGS
jgi:hypothetical protein